MLFWMIERTPSMPAALRRRREYAATHSTSPAKDNSVPGKTQTATLLIFRRRKSSRTQTKIAGG
jgi:hypothetical protein